MLPVLLVIVIFGKCPVWFCQRNDSLGPLVRQADSQLSGAVCLSWVLMSKNPNHNFGKGIIGTRWGLSNYFLGFLIDTKLDCKDGVLVFEKYSPTHFPSTVNGNYKSPICVIPSEFLWHFGLSQSGHLLLPSHLTKHHPLLPPQLCFSWQKYVLEAWFVPSIKISQGSSEHDDPRVVARWLNLAQQSVLFGPRSTFFLNCELVDGILKWGGSPMLYTWNQRNSCVRCTSVKKEKKADSHF